MRRNLLVMLTIRIVEMILASIAVVIGAAFPACSGAACTGPARPEHKITGMDSCCALTSWAGVRRA